MNYVNNLSIFGFMNKNCLLGDNCLEFWKNKSKTQLVRCILPFDIVPNNIKKLSYMYLDSDPHIKGTYMMDQVTSDIDESFLKDQITRKNHREIYEAYRKYKTRIEVIEDINIIKERYDDIIQMIEEWRYADYGGMKYMWQERAGVDKAFFQRYISNPFLQEQISVYIFTHKELDNKIIGYSIMPNIYMINEYNLPEFSYMLRKCLLKNDKVNLRNITLYIDWWTFYTTMVKHKLYHIAINWGCSSGGVKKYKENKWPILYKENKWFVNLKF